MQKKILPLLATLLLTTNVQAQKPDHCPTVGDMVADVKNMELTVRKEANAWWSATTEQFSNFGTTDEWLFSMFVLNADSSDAAAQKVKENLTSLHYQDGPKKIDNIFEAWACTYTTTEGYIAVVINMAFKIDASSVARKMI